MSYFRSCVDRMQGYVPGEQPKATQTIIKLNTNENPYPPSPHVREAILRELGEDGTRLRLYSDPAATELRTAAAERFGFDVAQILAGNGSDELLALLVRALVEPGSAVVYPYPTYVLYETLANAQGATVRTVDFDTQFTLPKQLWGETAPLVFVANPNAPSGNRHSTEQLRSLAESLQGGVLVVDEAYGEFAEDNALELARTLPNVVVLRTFSKSYSLAGMRLGLLFGSEQLVAGLNKVKDSYNLDRLAIAAGAAALRDVAWVERNVERIKATRRRLVEALQALGVEVLPSEANFVLARFGSAQAAQAVYQRLRDNNILVRYFSMRALDDAVRITVGTDVEIDALLAVLQQHRA